MGKWQEQKYDSELVSKFGRLFDVCMEKETYRGQKDYTSDPASQRQYRAFVKSLDPDNEAVQHYFACFLRDVRRNIETKAFFSSVGPGNNHSSRAISRQPHPSRPSSHDPLSPLPVPHPLGDWPIDDGPFSAPVPVNDMPTLSRFASPERRHRMAVSHDSLFNRRYPSTSARMSRDTGGRQGQEEGLVLSSAGRNYRRRLYQEVDTRQLNIPHPWRHPIIGDHESIIQELSAPETLVGTEAPVTASGPIRLQPETHRDENSDSSPFFDFRDYGEGANRSIRPLPPRAPRRRQSLHPTSHSMRDIFADPSSYRSDAVAVSSPRETLARRSSDPGLRERLQGAAEPQSRVEETTLSTSRRRRRDEIEDGGDTEERPTSRLRVAPSSAIQHVWETENNAWREAESSQRDTRRDGVVFEDEVLYVNDADLGQEIADDDYPQSFARDPWEGYERRGHEEREWPYNGHHLNYPASSVGVLEDDGFPISATFGSPHQP